MHKVVSQFKIGKYTVLTLDNELPMKKYFKYSIDGKEYNPVPVYDADRCIAIQNDGEFVGKIVEFI